MGPVAALRPLSRPTVDPELDTINQEITRLFAENVSVLCLSVTDWAIAHNERV